MFFRLIRFLLTLALIGIVFAGVGYYIYVNDQATTQAQYDQSVTLAIESAVARALFDATRTLESDIPHYRVITLGENEFLADVARQYNTTLEVLRMANSLLPSVEAGSGQSIIVPEGVQRLDPPRRFKEPYTAIQGDSLEAIAARERLPLEVVQADNPVLAQRGVSPGDLIFIAQLL